MVAHKKTSTDVEVAEHICVEDVSPDVETFVERCGTTQRPAASTWG
jgi:hypothetical protein